MSATVLSAGDHRQFIKDGYVVLRGAVPIPVVEKALEVIAARGEAFDGVKDAEIAACVTARVWSAVGELVGPRHEVGRLGQCQVTPRAPTPGMAWSTWPHLDNVNAMLLPESWAIGGMVFLTPVRGRDGAFCIRPGSPRRNRSLLCSESAECIWELVNDEPVTEFVEIIANPGDVVLFSHLMSHGASVNMSDRTRQAIQIRFRPDVVIPALTAADQQSTLEKANSATYLRDVIGDELALPVIHPQLDLASGYSPPGAMTTHDVIRTAGLTQLWWVSPDSLSTIHRAHTNTFSEWHPLTNLHLTDWTIRALHIEHRRGFTLTLVCDEGSLWYLSGDMEKWTLAGAWPGVRAGRPQYAHGNFLTRQAKKGHLLYLIDHDSVRWLGGADRSNSERWTDSGVAATLDAPPMTLSVWPVEDFVQLCTVYEYEHTSSRYGLSNAVDELAEPAPFTGQPNARRVRLLARGRHFWLVHYVNEDALLRWGTIDWASDPGCIRPVRTGNEMRDALARVGLA